MYNRIHIMQISNGGTRKNLRKTNSKSSRKNNYSFLRARFLYIDNVPTRRISTKKITIFIICHPHYISTQMVPASAAKDKVGKI